MRCGCSEWKPIITWPQEENGGPTAFTKDGKSLFAESSLGYDTTRLVKVPWGCLSTRACPLRSAVLCGDLGRLPAWACCCCSLLGMAV